MLDVEELRSRRREPGSRVRRRRRWALPVMVLAVPLVAFGGWHLVEAVSKLREAHLHRQKWGEGVRFIQVWFQVLLGTTSAVAGAAALAVGGWWGGRWPRRVGLVSAALVVIGVAGVWGAVLYVEWHGHRCIGPCG